MLKLMKLEMRKFRIHTYIRAAIIANVVILGLFCLFSYNQDVAEDMPFTDFGMAFSVMDTLVRATYVVFAAVLLSRIVIDEYRNKSITVLFMYPIDRRKLIAAKLLVVVLFTLFADIGANLFAGLGFLVADSIWPVIPEPFTLSIAARTLSTVVMSAVATSFLSLIPLYFGMRKHSGSATVVSSFIVVAIVCQTVDGFSLYSIVAIPIGLACLGAAVAYLSIRNIGHADVLK